MDIGRAQEIIFCAQVAAYPNIKPAAELGEIHQFLVELEQYRNLGTVEELRELAELDKAGRLVRVPANDVHTDPGLVYMLKNLDALLGAINGYELFLTRKAAQAAMEGTT